MSKARSLLTFICAQFFIFTGLMHFLKPGLFAAIVPEGFPSPMTLVYISGLCEIAGGIGLLNERTKRIAGWGLIALLVAVFPANINMAVNCIDFGVPHELLWWRLPLQGLLIAWVWWCGLSGWPAQKSSH